jgi:hypothetical protein
MALTALVLWPGTKAVSGRPAVAPTWCPLIAGIDAAFASLRGKSRDRTTNGRDHGDALADELGG